MEPSERKPFVEECTGCDHIEGDVCRIRVSPSTKWRTGLCPSATHVKVDIPKVEQKVLVGRQQQKQKKK